MLSQEYRLKAAKDFTKVKKEGKAYKNKYFTLIKLFRKDSNPTRFGFVVSKAVSPHATKRNRIKRVLDEALRQNIIYIKNGYDCVVIAHIGADRAYTTDIFNLTRVTLSRAKLEK